MDSAETRRRAAAERQRRRRDRAAEGLRVGRVEIPDGFSDFAVELGLITETEADMANEVDRAASWLLAEAVRDRGEQAERALRGLPRDWVAYETDGASLSSAEKRAWVDAHGLSGAHKHELQNAVKAAGLWGRWYAPETDGEECPD